MALKKLDQSILYPLPVETLTVVTKPYAKLSEWALRCSIVAGFIFLFYLSITGNIFEPVIHSLVNLHWSRMMIRPSLLWSFMGIILLTFRTVLWFRYRPFPSAEMDKAPFLTVIIPAYNEGAMVENSIDSVAQALYPRDRLEIFVVDDGSKDDTWEYIKAAAERYPKPGDSGAFPQEQGKTRRPGGRIPSGSR